MRVRKNEKEKEAEKFPKLLENKSTGDVILATGVICETGKADLYVGTVLARFPICDIGELGWWDSRLYKDYEGEVTLSND